MPDDILSEAPAYQSIKRRGREEERQLRVSSLRQKLLTIFENRFPKLQPLTKKLVVHITRPEVLEDLMVKLALAKDFNDAQEALLELAALDD